MTDHKRTLNPGELSDVGDLLRASDLTDDDCQALMSTAVSMWLRRLLGKTRA